VTAVVQVAPPAAHERHAPSLGAQPNAGLLRHSLRSGRSVRGSRLGQSVSTISRSAGMRRTRARHVGIQDGEEVVVGVAARSREIGRARIR